MKTYVIYVVRTEQKFFDKLVMQHNDMLMVLKYAEAICKGDERVIQVRVYPKENVAGRPMKTFDVDRAVVG